MAKTILSVKLDSEVIKRVKTFCAEHGIKYGFFVEKALEEKLAEEELKEDLLDLKTLKDQEKLAIPLEDYLKIRRV
jgi:predicted transcriptional regulator